MYACTTKFTFKHLINLFIYEFRRFIPLVVQSNAMFCTMSFPFIKEYIKKTLIYISLDHRKKLKKRH